MTLPDRRSTSDPARREWDLLSEFDRLNRRMTELFDLPFDRLRAANGGFVPAADLEETDSAFIVEIELPGVKRNDIDVELTDRRLSVTGERKEKERTGILRRRTRTVGRFSYEVVFPADVDDEDVTAGFEDGVLTVTVPKAHAQRPRRIEIS